MTNTERLTLEPSKVGELGRLERLCSVDEVRQIELRDVVADDEVGVHLLDEFLPADEQVGLLLELDDLGADDVGAGVEGKDVANERLGLACSRGRALKKVREGGEMGRRGSEPSSSRGK